MWTHWTKVHHVLCTDNPTVVSTGVQNKTPLQYGYADTTFAKRKTAPNLEVEKAENEISFTSCSAYGVHKQQATTEDTNHDFLY